MTERRVDGVQQPEHDSAYITGLPTTPLREGENYLSNGYYLVRTNYEIKNGIKDWIYYVENEYNTFTGLKFNLYQTIGDKIFVINWKREPQKPTGSSGISFFDAANNYFRANSTAAGEPLSIVLVDTFFDPNQDIKETRYSPFPLTEKSTKKIAGQNGRHYDDVVGISAIGPGGRVENHTCSAIYYIRLTPFLPRGELKQSSLDAVHQLFQETAEASLIPVFEEALSAILVEEDI